MHNNPNAIYYVATKYLITFVACIALIIMHKNPIERLFYGVEKKTTAHDKQSNDAAQTFYKNALEVKHLMCPELARIGQALAHQEKYEEATHFFQMILAIDPQDTKTSVLLGQCLFNINKYDQAVEQFNNALALSPDYVHAHYYKSKSLSELQQFDQALLHAQKAAKLQPNNVHTFLNLGHIYNKQGKPESAIEHYRKALSIDPNLTNAHYNIGYTLYNQINIPQSISALKKAIELNPRYAEAHLILANCYLLEENFEQAHQEFITAWKINGLNQFSIPFWDGSDLNGKTIFLRDAYGLGDTMQYIRYAKVIKDRGGKVLCHIQKPLAPLLSTCPYIDKFVSNLRNEKVDFQALLPNLPILCKTTPQTTPAEIPYIKANQKLVAHWNKQLKPDKNFKIGLCWHVDAKHDAIKLPIARRSIPLKLFEPLTQVKNSSFYSLQKNEIKNLPAHFSIKTFGPDFDESHGSFMDSAAVVENLDLIITADTAIAHLAGALGKKVWVLLPFSPDSRWLLHRTDTPWYPTMRLFRQPKPGDWQHVIKTVAEELEKLTTKKEANARTT